MTKLSSKHIDPADFGTYINNLWSAFTLMDSKDDIRKLFKDLFTHTEYKMFAKRLEIARRLCNQETYEIIQRDLKVTAGTVSNVNNILAEKGEGLRKAHEKLTDMESKKVAKNREKQKDLENPFRRKLKHGSVLGSALKTGIYILDKQISKKIKQSSAKKILNT